MIQLTELEIAWNTLWLILLAIASLLTLINKLDDNCKYNNIYPKLAYGGLSIVSLLGLWYPVTFGLIGINIMITIILVIDFFRYDKNNKSNKW